MNCHTDEKSGFEVRLQEYSKSSGSFLPARADAGLALGTVAAFAVCTTESEAVTLITLVGEPITPGTPNNVLLDFDINGLANDIEFAASDLASYPFVKAGARNGIEIAGRANGAYFYASRLATNATIDFGNNFLPADPAANKNLAISYPASALTAGDWFGGETGFIGIRIPNAGPEGDFNYGWIEVLVNPDSFSGEVIRYGIESEVDEPAIAGVGIPETSSLACLAMGAAGLLGWRQRRKSA